MKLKGASEELIADFEKAYKDSSINAEVVIESSLTKSAKAFDKVVAMQKSAEIMKKSQKNIVNNLSKKYPNEKAAISSAANVVDNNVKEKVRGDLKGIAIRMTKGSKAGNLAKNHLGVGVDSELIVKRSQAKEASQARGR